MEQMSAFVLPDGYGHMLLLNRYDHCLCKTDQIKQTESSDQIRHVERLIRYGEGAIS